MSWPSFFDQLPVAWSMAVVILTSLPSVSLRITDCGQVRSLNLRMSSPSGVTLKVIFPRSTGLTSGIVIATLSTVTAKASPSGVTVTSP